MSNEDNLHGLEDLDDTRVTAAELQATPMSLPPANKEKRKAKFKLSQVPREAYQSIKVFDRYGVEQKHIIEFDPETFQGKRLSSKGQLEDCFLFNGYVVADGLAHPDEEQLPEIVENVRKEVKLKGKVSANASTNIEQAADRSTRTLLRAQETPAVASLKCPKCQSMLRMDEIIEENGEVKHGIVCSNGNCGMSWHTNGGPGQG